ncbi:MAG: Cobalamin synthase [Devosia sp.]|nr:Cobalamin synthase [Devosia sp.]
MTDENGIDPAAAPGAGNSDGARRFDPSREIARALVGLTMSLKFYSRLPLGGVHVKPELDAMAPIVPLASLIIGIVPVLVLLTGTWLGIPSLISAAIAVAALIIVTGGLAEDGLADAADGLLGGDTPERRLEIFRDSRHGTFGVSALALLLLIRVGAIGAFIFSSSWGTALIWLAAMVVARSGALWLPTVLSAARADGLASTAGRVKPLNFVIGFLAAFVVAYLLTVWFTNWYAPFVMLVPMALVALAWTFVSRRYLGGQTGDMIGALQALLEVTALTALITLA